MPASEERKLVTVLFADLVGSTAYAGDRDPERVRAQLERFYDAMREEIELTGGTVEKFAGDAVMAVFGAPVALEDHAERALHAALAMQQRLRELFAGEVEMRVGVNTGDVVVGSPREGSSFVTGDAVNVADRLQKAAEPGEVLAGERTVAAVVRAFEFSAPRTVEAKGKEGGVVGRAVERVLQTMKPRGVGGLRRVFVGRDSELELLRATYRRAAAQSEPHLVTIVGEPGVGKSRLVRELWDTLTKEKPEPVNRTGRCLAYGTGITYWPLGEMVREHFELREGVPAAEVVARLEGREILALALGLDVAPELHPLDARERLHAAAVSFVEELASGCPTVLVVEDIHWAEPDLLDLLERLAGDVRAPVMLLATARPEILHVRSTWGTGKRNTTVLWLDPLSATAVSQLLDEKLPAMPDELRELVIERAGGNPFFLEELVGELLDSGVLVHTADGWALGAGGGGVAMPDTVHAVLAARIDRLPENEKAALQAGAVMGRVFSRAGVVHLLQGLEPDFELLEERDLVVALRSLVPGDDREVAMKHALTREVAYGSIPKARRGRLHAALADWLEEASSDERAPVLAYHYAEAAKEEDADLVWTGEPVELARVRRRAVHWLSRAGRLARGRHEMDEAVELYSRAVELSDDEHERALLWRAIGEAYALKYDGEGMRTALLCALEGPLDDVERADTYAFLAFQSSIRSAMWSIRLNMELIDEWASRALELAEDGTEAKARALLARANIALVGAPNELLEDASALADELDSLELRSFALGARTQAAFDQRRFREAASWSEQRLALLPGIDDPDHLCEAYEAGSPAAAAVCRFDEARRLAELHGSLSQRLSAHHRVHSVSLELELADALGDWSGLAAHTDRALAAIDANLATPCVRNPRDLLLLGLAHFCLGDESRGAELEREGLRLAGEGYETYLSGAKLRIAMERGHRRAMESLIELPVERALVWGPGVFAARLDAFISLGRHDLIEAEAPALVEPGTTVEPFALRALAVARRDDELLVRADERFAALGLEWHRAQLERLLGGSQ
ncbi:MAG TPA: adenylate/guanylate cyclase domain-containing protein [Gaiellaceae bacterium]|nr:adenylate/guanylate cyclase domain-containing protein [Gaiellaceae bacterium]